MEKINIILEKLYLDSFSHSYMVKIFCMESVFPQYPLICT